MSIKEVLLNRISRIVRNPELMKDQQDRMKARQLKYIDNNLEIENMKYEMEESTTKKRTIQIRIAVLELRKEQLLRN